MFHLHNIRISVCAGAALLSACLLFSGCGEQPVVTPPPTIAPPVEETQVLPPEESGENPTDTAPETTPEPTPSPAPTAQQPQGVDMFYSSATEYPAMPAILADPNLTQDQRIAKIKEWFYADEADPSRFVTVDYDEMFSSYWLNGALVKADVREQLNGAKGTVYHYYYKDSMPYFVFIVNQDTGDETRLYFWNGQLIRWIGPDHVTHNADNPEYSGYAAAGWRTYQIMMKLDAQSSQ